MKVTVKSVLIGGIIFLIFLFFSNIISLPFALIKIDPQNLPKLVIYLYTILAELLFLIIIIMIYYKDYKNGFNKFKKNYNKYFKKYVKNWMIALIIMGLSNFILNSIFNKIANNEDAIRTTFSNSPLYVYLAAVFIAPILEESIFRLNLRKMFETKWVYILFSGLTFGALHVLPDLNNWYDLLYIIPYSALGIEFARIYYHTNNVFASTLFHFLHNGILISLQFIILIFG